MELFVVLAWFSKPQLEPAELARAEHSVEVSINM